MKPNTRIATIGIGLIVAVFVAAQIASRLEQGDNTLLPLACPEPETELLAKVVAPAAVDGHRQLVAREGTITVVDGSGTPLAGAVLCEASVGARFGMEANVRATSDANGILTPPGDCRRDAETTWVSMRGFVPTAWAGQDRVELERGASIHAIVTRLDGTPVPDCIVWVSKRGIMPTSANPKNASPATLAECVVPSPDPHAMFSGISDAQGRVTIEGMRPGQYMVEPQHESLSLAKITGLSNGGMVEAPSGTLHLQMEPVLGARIEFLDEDLVTYAYQSPRQLHLQCSRGMLERNGPSGTERVHWLEVEGTPRACDHEREVTLFALLASTGPIKVPIHLVPLDDPGYLTVHRANGNGTGIGQAVVQLTDAVGRPVPARMLWSMTKGLRISSLSRNEVPELDPKALAWDAAITAGEECRLQHGSYELTTSSPFLRRMMEKKLVDIRAEQETRVEVGLPLRIGKIEFTYLNPTAQWWAEVKGETADGIADSRTVQVAGGERLELWLPEGRYTVTAYAAGYERARNALVVDGADVVIEFAAPKAGL
ncbi:MAG: hypothetical protein KDC98_18370 [Planctomycetes bacterium]|nr:hypothetical protein [Planctomycetota bacterium]